MTQIEKIRHEIDRRLTLASPYEGDYVEGQRSAYRIILSFLDTLEESVEGLEEAAERYDRENSVWSRRDGRERYLVGVTLYHAFKAGAKWMADQGETIEDEVGACQDAEMTPLVEVGPKTFKVGDKVIVQIRKK